MSTGLIFITFEILLVLLVGFMALIINFGIIFNRNLRTYKKDIRTAVYSSIIFFLAISIVVLHIVAFFNAPNLQTDYNSGQEVSYNIFNWPSQYINFSDFSDFEFNASWPFAALLLFDTIVSLLATLSGAIVIPIVSFLIRKSKQRENLKNIIKKAIFIIISVDFIICAEWFFVNLMPNGRTIFIVILISASIILPILIIRIWRPLIVRLTNKQNKPFSERMRELTNNFVQVSASADLILEQMKQTIETHEKEINNREIELSDVEHRLLNLSQQEVENRKRIKSLVETSPDAEKEFEKMLDKRDRNGLAFSLINLLIGAILGVIAYAIAHNIHLWGL